MRKILNTAACPHRFFRVESKSNEVELTTAYIVPATSDQSLIFLLLVVGAVRTRGLTLIYLYSDNWPREWTYLSRLGKPACEGGWVWHRSCSSFVLVSVSLALRLTRSRGMRYAVVDLAEDFEPVAGLALAEAFVVLLTSADYSFAFLRFGGAMHLT